MKRGSALLLALWVIAVLSVIVISFAYEAHSQTAINIYVRERNRVGRLLDAGRILGEVVLVGYEQVSDWSEDEDFSDLFEEDRWFREKRALKNDSHCTIGPILLDEENPDSGMVKIEIEMANGGSDGGININELYEGGDNSWRLRWEMIFQSHGLPLDFEIETDDGRFILSDHLIACWNDWRDENEDVTLIDAIKCGAEKTWYDEYYEDENTPDEDQRQPRNGSIPDVQELAYIRGFRDYPQVLTGGSISNGGKSEDDQITMRGIVDLFSTSGSTKINVNSCSLDLLLTVPGIFDEDDDEDMADGKELAQAILDTLKIMPDYDVDENRDFWPYKDFSDMVNRVSDAFNLQIGTEASQYLIFKPESTTVFKVKITAMSLGFARSADAKCYVKDKEVRYIEWREN